MIMVCVAALGDQWYHMIPIGGWEKATAHGFVLGCALDLTGFCVEKLSQLILSLLEKLH